MELCDDFPCPKDEFSESNLHFTPLDFRARRKPEAKVSSDVIKI